MSLGQQYENIANKFAARGYFDCELGNTTPLATANVLQVSLIIISSTENFPVIPVIPRKTVTSVPLHISPVNLWFVIKQIATEFFSLPYIPGWSTEQQTKNLPKSVKGNMPKFHFLSLDLLPQDTQFIKTLKF